MDSSSDIAARRFGLRFSMLIAPSEGPDCATKRFSYSGIDFAIEYWIDGRNKSVRHVLIAIWNALRVAGIEIPYPHRAVELKGRLPS